MSRYFVNVSYDGTEYFGFQKQNEKKTIQGAIEETLSTILNESTKISASGRTDAGVHAHGQTFHFDTEKTFDIGKLRYSMNRLLPKDIHIISIEPVDESFHARMSAVAKKYVYQINLGEQDPFLSRYAYHLGQEVDLEAMKKAANAWLGTHCFQNLTTKEIDDKSFVRTVYAIRFETQGNLLRITFIGNGFMRYMIRMMVDALIAIGLHKEDISFAKQMIDTENRQTTRYKAPANGLFLERVYYPSSLSINYHTHTKRCGHALGEDEEYVLAAIQAGICVLGFSDHIFYPNLRRDPFYNVRGDYSEMEDYCDSFQALKEKYQSQIELHLGFEAEYYPEYHDYYQELLQSKKVEYLILGQHFFRDQGWTETLLRNEHDVYGIKRYANTLITGMKTGFYSYVAHPDLFLAGYASFDDYAREVSYDICSAAKELNLPLEMNLAGIRKGFHTYGNGERRFLYPHREFWKIASELGCKVVIGIDAHQPSDFSQKELFLALELIEDLKLQVVDFSTFSFKKWD